MKIKELAKRIASELEADEDGECYLAIYRDWTPEDRRGLRRSTIEALLGYKERIDRAVPNEFGYGMFFDDGRVHLMFQFSDGDRASAGWFHPTNPRHDAIKLAAELRNLDWNQNRTAAIQGSNLTDDIADHAEDYFPEWIPTSVIHETYSDVISDYMAWLIEAKQASGVLAGDRENLTLLNCTVESDEQRNHWISLQMGQGNLIIGVVENGLLLSAEETDALRRQELDNLPRIAKAKAEGRFQKAFEELSKGALQS